MPKKKAAVRRDWTNDDVRTLKALAKQRAGVAKIAKKLKRTPGAAAAKACAFRYFSEHNVVRQYVHDRAV